ncbi:hypothetical protein [Moorena sp. SIOASIH]|uniref:hypothetical protein n=1 Tax=Moorena sp. SIOASIH TaxID=2607817 RepID=UPI0025E34024|nr:hypothetical protein [Moorena sp. SIOASIH]
MVPLASEIAPKALKDSGITAIEKEVIQTIIKNSGWNLLSSVCAKLDKACKAIEDTFNTAISGWGMELKKLQKTVEEYKHRSDLAKKQVGNVKKVVKAKEQELIERYMDQLNQFSDLAKLRIRDEFQKFAESRKPKDNLSNISPINIFGFGGFGEFGWIKPLEDLFKKQLPFVFDSSKSGSDPYKIKIDSESQAQKVLEAINDFCQPAISDWWMDTEDRLIREGNKIQEELRFEIQQKIQEISNYLSSYLRESLKIKLNHNPIQFPSYEFPTIDDQIKKQQESYRKYEVVTKYKSQTEYRKEKHWVEGGFCGSGYYDYSYKPYTVEVPYEDKVATTKSKTVYEIDLNQTATAITKKIDQQSNASKKMLERIIDKQVMIHFRSAEQQISGYIEKFQNQFDRILKEREIKGAKAQQVRQTIELKKKSLKTHIDELKMIDNSLNAWKPEEVVK